MKTSVQGLSRILYSIELRDILAMVLFVLQFWRQVSKGKIEIGNDDVAVWTANAYHGATGFLANREKFIDAENKNNAVS